MPENVTTAEPETAATIVVVPGLEDEFSDRRFAVAVTVAVAALVLVALALALLGS